MNTNGTVTKTSIKDTDSIIRVRLNKRFLENDAKTEQRKSINMTYLIQNSMGQPPLPCPASHTRACQSSNSIRLQPYLVTTVISSPHTDTTTQSSFQVPFSQMELQIRMLVLLHLLPLIQVLARGLWHIQIQIPRQQQ